MFFCFCEVLCKLLNEQCHAVVYVWCVSNACISGIPRLEFLKHLSQRVLHRSAQICTEFWCQQAAVDSGHRLLSAIDGAGHDKPTLQIHAPIVEAATFWDKVLARAWVKDWFLRGVYKFYKGILSTFNMFQLWKWNCSPSLDLSYFCWI